jgi:hypothetical protein
MFSKRLFSSNTRSGVSKAGRCALALFVSVYVGLAGCGSPFTATAENSIPTITSFAASDSTIAPGSSSTLSWSTIGAANIAITPTAFIPTTSSRSASEASATSRTYMLASNAGGTDGTPVAAVRRAAAGLPVISSFTATPTSLSSGSGGVLKWVITGATKVAIKPGEYVSTLTSSYEGIEPKATTTYTLTASNATGSTTATVTVTVTAPAKPVIGAFTASPASITSGASSTLKWSATGATKVAVTPGTFTSTSASGSTAVSPTAGTIYTLTATNAAGTATAKVTVNVAAASKPVINSFSAGPASIASGASSALSWSTTGATSVSIAPGTFTSVSASGSTSVSPTAATTYTLSATNAAGTTTATAQVAIASSGGTLKIITTTCPGGTQGTAYAGCTITASGGVPPYTYSVSASATYPSLPEGLSLDPDTGEISSSLIGGQGTYKPLFVVTDSSAAQATQSIAFALNGSNAFLAKIFPATSIFHHRVDAATTNLPVDASPAAAMYSGYLASSVRPFFGTSSGSFPNGIPAIEVPYDQAMVPVTTSEYQSYFTSGPIPAYAPVEATSHSTGDRHVLVYRDAQGTTTPALYEMWVGINEVGSWKDSSNALWPDVSSSALTAQGKGTSDAAGLPVAPLLVNADEVIGTGSPTAPTGTVQHPIRFTLNHMLNYWVWPATQSAGVGSCINSAGTGIGTESEISQSAPPASCTMTGASGEIYRLKESVATPACASTSPQAAVIITAMRNYGIILADNGLSGGLIGTPDARWNDTDLSCLTKLILSDFEPVNVSSLMVSSDSGATSH